MQFASFGFLYLFLPFTLTIYLFLPVRLRQRAMLCFSLLFLLFSGISTCFAVLTITGITYGAGKVLERKKEKRFCSICLLLSITFLWIFVVLFMRSQWLHSWENTYFSGRDFCLPGISFLALQGVGYCIDIRRGKIRPAQHWYQFFSYLLFFPRIIMGPVVPYDSVMTSPYGRTIPMQQIGAGLFRFLIGLSKKLLLAEWLMQLFQDVLDAGIDSCSILILWLAAAAKWIAVFLELSGYADMAIGIANCFGYRLPESFSKSILYPSVTVFSQRWNRTISGWFSNYLGSHLGGSSPVMQFIAVLFIYSCMGVWYRPCLPALLWGAFIGVVICVEYILGKKYSQARRPLHYTITTIFFCISVLFLVLPDFGSIWQYTQGMLGFGQLIPTETDGYLLRSYSFIFLLSLYVVSGNWQTIFRWFRKKNWFRRLQLPLSILTALFLLFECTIMLTAKPEIGFQLF